uniref:O-antigen ligase family protein n=1 Tax=Vibrio kanaloae TaxID=170673 RepID=UPI001F0FB90D|nr:O-antigen ligase family protein [Vibrio kanaloae]
MLSTRINNLSSYLCGLGCFVAICIPSIKLLYSSSIINLFPIFLIISGLFVRGRGDLTYKKDILYFWLLFVFFLLVLIIPNLKSVDGVIFNFIYLSFLVFIALLSFDRTSVMFCSKLLLLWSVLLSFWQYFIGVNYSPSLGQTYLTVAMPIGCLLTFSLLFLLNDIKSIKKTILASFLVILSLLALSTLLSRGAVILPLLIFMVHVFFLLFFSNLKWINKFLIMFSIVFLVFVSLSYSNLIDMRQLYRIENLMDNLSNEPRVIVYSNAIDLIKDSPLFGYGTGSAGDYFHGTYPHNIFLDVLINGGVILLIAFILILTKYLCSVYRFYRFFNRYNDFTSTVFLAYSMYLFFQWNISWGLDSSYIPLMTMFMFIYNCRLKNESLT